MGNALIKLAGKVGGRNSLRPALDMSLDARMRRAEEMGLDTTPFFHGTTAKTNFLKFDPTRGAGTGVNELGVGVYAAPEAWRAESWARGPGGRVLPLLVPKERADYDQLARMLLEPSNLGYHRPLDDLVRRIVTNDPQWRGEEQMLVEQLRDIRRLQGPAALAKKAGYKAVQSFDSQVPGQVMVFDPRHVRSTFAKFNPERVDSTNLLD